MYNLLYLPVLALLCLIVNDAEIIEACHAGHTEEEIEDYYEYGYEYDDEDDDTVNVADPDAASSRSKRQIRQQHSDGFQELRRYFRACMLDKVPEQWEWKSIVDFSILQTVWFFYSGTVACSEVNGKDDAKCWKRCIDVYLRDSSSLRQPARDCVDEYTKDFHSNKVKYTPKSKHVEKSPLKPQDKYSKCIQAQYDATDSGSASEDTRDSSASDESDININTIVTFIRGHVMCGICDYSLLPSGRRKPDVTEIDGKELTDGSVVYTVTWPFSLEAMVRRDANLRQAINFCNQEFEVTFRKDPPPNPGWSQWFTWGNCDAVCGGTGTQVRIRVCLDDSPRSCEGRKTVSRVCHNLNCAHWSQWGEYTPCISTCDLSEKYSFRECVNGKIGDDGCQGPRMRSKSCAIAACEVPWSQWSSCSVTCGGEGIQRRKGGESFLRMKTEVRFCSSGSCPQQWSLWSPWGPCSKTCGRDGTHQRLRKCSSKTRCTGPYLERVPCGQHNPPCWRPRNDEWSSWSGCVFRRRSRVCNGPKPCPGGTPEEYQRCAQPATPEPRGWSRWSDWTRCTATCGPATRWRYRKCLKATSDPQIACSGNATQSQACNNVPCHYTGQPPCGNKQGMDDYCHTRYFNCNGQFARRWCKKTCRYC